MDNILFDTLLNFTRHYGYYSEYIFWTEGIELSYAIIPSLVIAIGIYFIPKLAKGGKILRIYTNLMLFAYIFTIVMLKHAIVERVSYYAYIYVILYIPELMLFLDKLHKTHLNKKLKKLAKEMEISPEIEKAGQISRGLPENIIKKYKIRRKMIAFCITAVVVTGTLSYNIYGLLSIEAGVHGVYPYQSWLYELPDIFIK